MSKKQRVERIFREEEVRHYIKPYIMYMTCIIWSIFNPVYDFKKANRRFLPCFTRCDWIKYFNIAIVKISKFVVVLIDNNQILITWFSCCFFPLLSSEYEKRKFFRLQTFAFFYVPFLVLHSFFRRMCSNIPCKKFRESIL